MKILIKQLIIIIALVRKNVDPGKCLDSKSKMNDGCLRL